MLKIVSLIVNLFKKALNLFTLPAFQYIIIRYLSYFLSFINSMLLLKYLGEYSFGLYSFYLMFLTYFSYLFMGTNHSLNTLLSIHLKEKIYSSAICNNSFSINLIISLIVSSFCMVFYIFNINLFSKFEFREYFWICLLIGITTSFCSLFVAIFRVYGKLKAINFYLIIQPILILSLVIFSKENNIKNVLFVMIVAQVLSLAFFSKKIPVKLKFDINIPIIFTLLKRGMHLMIQMLSYTYITLSATTLVSIFYLPENLGYYSLANTISISVVFLIESFMFILYPKILNRFANNDRIETIDLLNKIRSTYILGADCISLLSLCIIPPIFLFFPAYIELINILKLLTIAQIILNVTNGYTQYLISINKESYLTLSGLISILVVIIFGYILSSLNFSYYYMGVIVCMAMFVYSFLIVWKSYGVLNLNKDRMLFDFLPFGKIVAILAILVSFISKENVITPIIPFVLYAFLNYKKIYRTIILSYQTINSKGLLTI